MNAEAIRARARHTVVTGAETLDTDTGGTLAGYAYCGTDALTKDANLTVTMAPDTRPTRAINSDTCRPDLEWALPGLAIDAILTKVRLAPYAGAP
jgi:hypothetical protein